MIEGSINRKLPAPIHVSYKDPSAFERLGQALWTSGRSSPVFMAIEGAALRVTCVTWREKALTMNDPREACGGCL